MAKHRDYNLEKEKEHNRSEIDRMIPNKKTQLSIFDQKISRETMFCYHHQE